MGVGGDSEEKDYLLPGRPVRPHVQPQQIKMQPPAAARAERLMGNTGPMEDRRNSEQSL